MRTGSRVRFRELRPTLWPAFRELFGKSGACGGCWCMWWRVPRGGKLWEETKGRRARGLLAAALGGMRRHKVTVVEAYPVTTTKEGKRLAAAFSWTGPLAVFEEAGFEEIQRLAPARPLVRLQL